MPLEWLLLPLLAILSYLPAINGPFLFDDRDSVLNNAEIQSGNWIKTLWYGHWTILLDRRLTSLTYCLQAIWPKTSRSFHLVNVLLHAANGGLAMMIQRARGEDEVTIWLSGLLFVVGPFAVNAAGFITGRAAMLAASFGMLGVWAILIGHPLWALPLILPAVMAKEDAIVFLALFGVVSFMEGYWFWFVFPVFPVFALSALSRHERHTFLWKRLSSQQTGDMAMRRGGLPGSLPRWDHAVTVMVETVIHYPLWALGLKNAPYHGSGFEHPPLWKIAVAVSILAASGMCAFTIQASRLPLLLVWMGPWWIYVAAPVPDQLFEHRYYASAFGWSLLGPLAGFRFEIWTAILITLASLTVWNANAWRDGVLMWTACLRRGSGEKSRAWQELGAEYKITGHPDKAIPCFQKALELNPRLAPAMRNLAWLAVDQRRMEDAESWLRLCTHQCPDFAPGWEELGRVLSMQKKVDPSDDMHRQALELDGQLDYSHNRLGLKAYRERQWPQAISRFQQALALAPRSIEYRWNLACSLRADGQKEAAREVIQPLPHNETGAIQVQLNDSMIVPEGMTMVAQ